MLFSIPAILLVVSPIASLSYSDASAFCKIGACLNAHKSTTGTGAWPSQIVSTVDKLCAKSGIRGDRNIASACAALKKGIDGKRSLSRPEQSVVSTGLSAFGDSNTGNLLRAFGGLGGLQRDASGKYCWALHKNSNYGNGNACY